MKAKFTVVSAPAFQVDPEVELFSVTDPLITTVNCKHYYSIMCVKSKKKSGTHNNGLPEGQARQTVFFSQLK